MPTRRSLLTDDLLERFAKRTAAYDRDNTFFTEDYEELKQLGYLRIAVPEKLGGFGFGLSEVAREQRRLAYRSPATALAINMHVYWTGAAAGVHAAGDDSLDWLLEAAARGELFASGHGEPGNDLGLGHSNVRAEPRPDGGYRFYGRKIFTSLSPVWDWLGVHALDDSDPERPKVVHAFIRRDAPGHRSARTWDTLSVRPTSSDDTILEGVAAEPASVSRVIPAGPPDDAFILGIFGWALPLFGEIYSVVDLAVRIYGGAALFRTGELERLIRDVQAGPFHPPNANLVHDVVGKAALGVS